MSQSSPESESRFAEVVVPQLLADFAPLIGANSRAQRVPGGLVHYVYNVRSDNGSYYLKIRGNNFSTLPDLPTNPKHILYERAAAERFYSALPGVFPRVLGFSPEHSAMLLTDVNPSGITLDTQLNDKLVTPEHVRLVGATLGSIHTAFAEGSTAIREDGDSAHYENNLNYRLLRFNNQSLNRAAEELRHMPKQLILSDPSPKNIGQNEQGNVTMFDLDQVHLGNPIFDIAYLTGHIALHTANDPDRMVELTSALARGYQTVNPTIDFGSRLFKQITGASILYRLQNKVIPYATPLNEQQRQSLIQGAYAMID